MHNDNEKLLLQNIQLLPLTEELKNVLVKNNIGNLQELLGREVHAWHKNFSGFTYHHQHEIVSYLDRNKLAHLLKED
jgi:hypothetical protein